jgi:hypothetical protein
MKEFRPGRWLQGSSRCYQALDNFAESIAAAPADAYAIRARELELGPLAELLVLRRQWVASAK